MQRRTAAIGIVAIIGATTACAQLIGADFDVHAASCDANACVEEIQGHLAFPFDITTSQGDVFWTVQGNRDAGPGAIMVLAGDGGAVSTLASVENAPNRIFATSDTIYWTAIDGVWSIPRAGGSPRQVAAVPLGAIGLYVNESESTVYWVAGGQVNALSLADGGADGGTPITNVHPAAAMVTSDGKYLYFDTYDGTNGSVYKLDPAQPMEEIPLSQGQDKPDGLAIAGAYLLFVTANMDGTLSYVQLTGGPTNTLAIHQETPATVAVDPDFAYWPTATGGEIRKTDSGGPGIITTLASGQTSPNGIAVDQSYVYWTNYDVDGGVMRTPK